MNGYVEVSKASDAAASKHFASKSVTIEAWLKLDATVAARVGYQGVAGNLYSFVTQALDSKGAGHFGYGIVCETKFGGDTYCGTILGMMNDFSGRTSLQGLCPSLSFQDAVFCGGTPGWTAAQRAESTHPIQPGVWTHIAGSYNHTTGLYVMMVNGEEHVRRTLSFTRDDATTGHPEIYYTGDDGAYPGSITFPRHRMDWNIGRQLVGEKAPTVATAPWSYFAGTIDDVRVWSYGKSADFMRQTSYLDTVSPSSRGLLGYWPFDDPSYYHNCADETRLVRDAMAEGGHEARLHGPALIIQSTSPLDRVPVFSADTPANNSELVVYLGDTIKVAGAAHDDNPTDELFLVLTVPGSQYSHPSGATFSDVSERGAQFTWSPLPRDAGKNVSLCFALSNVVTNPLRPSFALKQAQALRCVKVRVPLCVYKAQQGDTVRSIARQFNTNWRTLFMINPEIGHPNDVAAGLTMRIGSIYRMRAHDKVDELAANARVTWTSLANNNAAIVNKLWTDQYFRNAGTYAGRSSVIPTFDPGEAVYDIIFDDLAMQHNYTGTELCLVAQLNSNCI